MSKARQDQAGGGDLELQLQEPHYCLRHDCVAHPVDIAYKEGGLVLQALCLFNKMHSHKLL
jgi:hypothetical protein